jgi:hypothetical protein
VSAQPGRPASSGSVTLHDHFGSPGRLVMCCHAADHAALDNGDAIGAPGCLGRSAARQCSRPSRRSFAGFCALAPKAPFLTPVPNLDPWLAREAPCGFAWRYCPAIGPAEGVRG